MLSCVARKYAILMVSGAVLMGVAGISRAQAADLSPDIVSPVPPEPTTSGWHFTLTPYFWAAGLNGDVQVFPRVPVAHIDESFSDVWHALNFAAMGAAELRNDRFGFLTDLVYVDTEVNKHKDLEIRGVSGRVSGDLETKLFNATTSAFYALYNSSAVEIDVLAGARVWAVDTDLNLNFERIASAEASSSFSWVDPIVGARAHINFSQRFSATVYGDVGGFGAGAKIDWQVFGTLNYALTKHWTTSAGYRYLAVDYENGGHIFNVNMGGPVIAASYRF
jgi:hypothetical protein